MFLTRYDFLRKYLMAGQMCSSEQIWAKPLSHGNISYW